MLCRYPERAKPYFPHKTKRLSCRKVSLFRSNRIIFDIGFDIGKFSAQGRAADLHEWAKVVRNSIGLQTGAHFGASLGKHHAALPFLRWDLRPQSSVTGLLRLQAFPSASC